MPRVDRIRYDEVAQDLRQHHQTTGCRNLKEAEKRLVHLDAFRLLKEAAPRAGFFESAQYEAVRRRLKPDLQVAVALAYHFGWRVRDEVLTLERRQLDLEAGTVRLDPGTTKNEDGRVVYLTPELTRLLGEQLGRVRGLERKLGRIIPAGLPVPGGAATGQGSGGATAARPGRSPAGRPACPGCCDTTSGGPPSATW